MKYIFCDLDGTLLHDFHLILDSDIKALQQASQQGNHVAIATGRLDYEIKGLMEHYQLNGFRVSQNGAVVIDDKDNLLYQSVLKKEYVHLILEVLKDYNVLVFVQTKDHSFVPKRISLIEDFEAKQSFTKYIEKTDIFETIDEYDVVTISLWAEKDENILIQKSLQQVLPEDLIAYISSDYTIDITNQANSKGNGIKHLADHYGIDKNDIYVIGDSFNDIAMFDITNNSYVMENAHPDVKKHAKHVVSSVKEAIEHILK